MLNGSAYDQHFDKLSIRTGSMNCYQLNATYNSLPEALHLQPCDDSVSGQT